MTKTNKPQTKKAQLIKLLSTKSGTDVPSISEKLGWLPHTTRAALTGLRRAGYEVTSEKTGNGKPTRYRVIASPATETV
jgi:predicted ArsR family transcriptional regulator